MALSDWVQKTYDRGWRESRCRISSRYRVYDGTDGTMNRRVQVSIATDGPTTPEQCSLVPLSLHVVDLVTSSA